jgi:hypothetical protein
MFDNIRFNFLYIDTYSFGKNWVYPESIVPYNMLRYIEFGSGTFFIDDEEFVVSKSQIVYIPKGSRLSCYTTSENFSFTSIRFTNSVYFEGGDFLKDYYGIPNVIDGADEKIFFEKIYHYIKEEDPARMFFVRGYMELLIGHLIEKSNIMYPDHALKLMKSDEYSFESLVNRIKKATTKMDSRIQVVLDYVILHPSEEYSPQRLADMAELSKQRFSALFKEQVGKSPMEYIKDLKLTTAARKLLVSNVSISDIAYSIGYNDPNYFIREFKAAFGYTPRQYRLAAKE